MANNRRVPSLSSLKRQRDRYFGGRFQPREVVIPALLGDGLGNVDVNPEIKGLVRVRDGRGGPLGVAINNRVAPVDGTAILVVQERQGLFRIKETRETGAGNVPSVVDPAVTMQTPNVAVHPLLGPAHSDTKFDIPPEELDGLLFIDGKWTPFSSAFLFPRHATMWHHESHALSGNAFTSGLGISLFGGPGVVTGGTSLTSQYSINAYMQSPGNGDSFAQDFFLGAGTYVFNVLGVDWNDHGKIDWYLDNVLFLSGQDWYGTTNFRQTAPPKRTTGVVVPTSGTHTLKGVVSGKNASSSNYYMILVNYWFSLYGAV